MDPKEIAELRSRLQARNGYFQSLVNLIPTTGYNQEDDLLSGDEVEEKPSGRKQPDTKKKKQKQKKQKDAPAAAPVSETTNDEGEEEDADDKDDKMDISVSEISNDPTTSLRDNSVHGSTKMPKKKQKKHKVAYEKDEKQIELNKKDDLPVEKYKPQDIAERTVSAADSDSSMSSDEEVPAKTTVIKTFERKEKAVSKTQKVESGALQILPKMERSDVESNVDDLRENVRQKIEDMKIKRKAKDGKETEISKKRAKQLEKKKKKKAKIAAARAEKESAKGASPVVNGVTRSVTGSVTGSVTPTVTPSVTPSENEVQPEGQVSQNIIFSKFDFKSIEIDPGIGGKKKKRKMKGSVEAQTGKHYEHLLEKVQQKKEKFQKLKTEDQETATDWLSRETWRKAMLKVEGVKIKDDPELLKKSLRNRQKRKEKSKKKWEERVETTEKLMKEKQVKRYKNIKQKQTERKSKKVKRLQKKGKLLLKDTD